MLTVIIFMLGGVFIFIYYRTIEDRKQSLLFDWSDYFINSIFGITIGGLIGVLVALTIPVNTHTKIETRKIVSLQDNNSVYGSFFLGIGTIEGVMKYTFYYEGEDGMYRMMQLPIHQVSVRVNSIPKLNRLYIKADKGLLNKFGLTFKMLYDKNYIIDVPVGTIKNNYNLDAQ